MEKSSIRKVGFGVVVVVLVALATVFFGNNASNQTASNTQTSTSNPPDNTNDTTAQGQASGTGSASSSNDNSSSTPTSDTVAGTTNTSASQYTYKDGTYTATGSYSSPGGEDQIGVTVTIKNDIITNSSVTPMPGDNMSAKFQNMFAAGYKTYVIGKDITNLSVGKVSRSSLTPQGFNDALAQIRSQAKA